MHSGVRSLVYMKVFSLSSFSETCVSHKTAMVIHLMLEIISPNILFLSQVLADLLAPEATFSPGLRLDAFSTADA